MNILFKQAKIICPQSEYHSKTLDVLIEGGIITSIKKNIDAKANTKTIEEDDLHLSLGWIDMQVANTDPGNEHKEDLISVIETAASGGFTGICVHNQNEPATDNKAQIEYIINKTKNKIVDVFPFGTITMKGNSDDLSEMYDMKNSGAVGFSNHKNAIHNSGTTLRAIQYANSINALIITHCSDKYVAGQGQMNEGETSTQLGLKGIPALAEELMLQRNISILEYTGGKLHIPTISTKGSVELIKKAKAKNFQITCGVAAINLLCDDTLLHNFDSNYKVNPPLRSKKDVHALRNAVESGIIDVIVSDHFPQDVESKDLEFDLAHDGIINLQTAYSCCIEALGKSNSDAIVNCLATHPRKILELNTHSIAEGSEANLTAFSVNKEWNYNPKNNVSKSLNSPLLNKNLKGKVIGIVNGAKSHFN